MEITVPKFFSHFLINDTGTFTLINNTFFLINSTFTLINGTINQKKKVQKNGKKNYKTVKMSWDSYFHIKPYYNCKTH